MRQRSLLRQMIELHEGKLEVAEAQPLRKQIQQNENLQKRWRKIRRAFQLAPQDEPKTGPAAGVHASANGSPDGEVDAEMIAAFIDETLDSQRARQIEAEIWNSIKSMAELINELKFREELAIHQVSPRLSARVKQTIDDEMHRADESPNAKPSRSSTDSTLPRNRRLIVVASISVAAAILITISLLFAYQWMFPTQDLVQPEEPGTQSNPGTQKQLPNDDNDKIARRKGTQNGTNSNKNFPDKNDKPNPGSDDKLVDDRDPNPDRKSVPDDVDDDAIKEFQRWVNDNSKQNRTTDPANEKFPEIQWKQVKGLLAVRNSNEETLVGYQYPYQHSKHDFYTTLPNSWVRGTIAGIGNIVANASSSFNVSTQAQESNELVKVVIDYGQVAFQDLPAPSSMQFSCGDQRWPVEIVEEKTTVAIDASVAGHPKLIVQRGAARFRDREVRRGYEIVYSADANYNVRPSETNLTWVSRSQGTISLDAQSKSRLFASGDLGSDFLSHPIRFSGKQDREKQLAWILSLEPTRTYELSHHRDPGIQLATVVWLMQQRIDQPIGRQAWVTVARTTKQPRLVRQVYQWNLNLDSGRPIPARAVVEKMMELLTHHEVLFRLIASRSLSKVFGNPDSYHPSLPAAQRAQAAHRWRQSIMKRYNNHRNKSPAVKDRNENQRRREEAERRRRENQSRERKAAAAKQSANRRNR